MKGSKLSHVFSGNRKLKAKAGVGSAEVALEEQGTQLLRQESETKGARAHRLQGRGASSRALEGIDLREESLPLAT